VEQLTALACELEESAAELEEIASTVVSGVARTESLSSEIGNAVERGKELVARLKKRLGDRQT
jgi:methyl-accepting chemotaxis protein